MAFPRKGRRTLQVGDHTYYWVLRFTRAQPHPAEGVEDITISVLLEPCDHPGKRIEAHFEGKCTIPFLWEAVKQNIIISPQTVRDVIGHARAEGWTPQAAGKIFTIDHAEKLFTRSRVEIGIE